jgi:hypothetical protein
MKKEFYCTQCGYRGKPRKKIRGNGYIEVFLILFATVVPLYFYFSYLKPNYSQSSLYVGILVLICVIPEVVYRIWRNSGGVFICPMCKTENSMIADELNRNKKKPEKKIDEVEPDELICPRCLSKNDNVYKFCLNCGNKLTDRELEEPEDELVTLEEILSVEELDTIEDEDEEK